VIATPKGLPLAVRDKIRQDIAEAVASTDVQDRYATLGYVPLSLDRAKIEAFIHTESKRHEAIIKRAKIELQ
jgi:tripartite-type tricarboxylate transporter receptor subunit TctC